MDELEKFLPKAWKLEEEEGKLPFLVSDQGLRLSLDFLEKKNLKSNQPLFKAIGLKEKGLKVLDITAGWGSDAFLLSLGGSQVRAIEQNPLVFHFTSLSLRKAKALNPDLRKTSLEFVLGDSLKFLKHLKELPDVIYIDPMFEGRKKSLSGKALFMLRKIVGETKDVKLLFEEALKKAKKRVVVKRHRLEKPLKEKPLCTFKGRSTEYDVFSPVITLKTES